MKPKTKRQKELAKYNVNPHADLTNEQLNGVLPSITDEQKQWGLHNCLPHVAIRRKTGKISCLDCGHSWTSKATQGWQDEVMGQDCPSCGTKLKIMSSRASKFSYDELYTIIDAFKGNQVIRTFKLSGEYFVGKVALFCVKEVSRIWITPKGDWEIFGYSRTNGYYGDRWFGEWGLKSSCTINNHSIHAHKYYPKRKIIKELKRNGFKSSLHSITPYSMFTLLLTEPMAETLIKAKQYELLTSMVSYHGIQNIKKHWSTIKICIKNNYIVNDVSDWYDHLDTLEYFNKDLLNSKYVCPEDFKSEHRRLNKKKRDILRKKKIKDLKDEIALQHKKYIKAKKKYFGLSFTDNNLTIVPIKSPIQLLKESDYLEHCAFNNAYHKRDNDLMLSARVGSRILETIQFSLNSFKVVQSRGHDNERSEYHKEIIALVNKNSKKIQTIALGKKVKRKVKQVV